MRRDMGLIRDLLRVAGDAQHPVEARLLIEPSRSWDEIVYNLDLIDQAGLAHVDFRGDRDESGHLIVSDAYIFNPSWEGNEFIDATRDDAVWKAVQQRIADTVQSATFDTVKTLAVKIATDMLMN